MRVKHAGALPRQNGLPAFSTTGLDTGNRVVRQRISQIIKGSSNNRWPSFTKELLKAALSGEVCSRCSLWVFDDADSSNSRLGT